MVVLDTSLARVLEIDIIAISTLYIKKKLTQRGCTNPSGLIYIDAVTSTIEVVASSNTNVLFHSSGGQKFKMVSR